MYKCGINRLKFVLILGRLESTLSSLEKINKNNMKSMIEGFPILLRETVLDEQSRARVVELHEEGIHGVCLIGMGGSSIAGEMCRGLLGDKANVPIVTVRDYSIPAFVNDKWVVIAVSYSGNTEETLSAFDEASSRGSRIVAVTTGGKLGKKSQSLPCFKLHPHFQPRAALPLILGAVLPTIEILLGLTPSNLVVISTKIEKHSNSWGTVVPSPQDLAKTLVDKIPMYIGAGHLAPVAYRAKCQVNENAKAIAISLEIPEANHNEIEAIRMCSKHSIKPIFLRSKWENKRVSKRFEATSKIYSSTGCSPKQLKFSCDSKLEEMLAVTHYVDMVSVELAELLNVNPVSVDRITQLKQILSED
jgi:glucose/mannose-6-phosphate isomerase